MRKTRSILIGVLVLVAGLGSAWAQISVIDPMTTARNAIVAGIRGHILDTITAQRERLEQMARRLSADTALEKYDVADPPGWQSTSALGLATDMRAREEARDLLVALSPEARAVLRSSLATLDAADSSLIVASDRAALLRAHGAHELRAIDRLEADALNPSSELGATAILDTMSGAALIEARQKQTRLHVLADIVEQLAVDNKRARDAEAAALNMRLRQLRSTGGEGGGFVTGASEDLRTWRQP